MKSIIIAAILFTLCAQALQTGVTNSMPTLQSSRTNSLLPFKALSILSLSAGILSRPGAVQAEVPLEVKDVAIKVVAAKATASAIAVGEEESILNSFISLLNDLFRIIWTNDKSMNSAGIIDECS